MTLAGSAFDNEKRIATGEVDESTKIRFRHPASDRGFRDGRDVGLGQRGEPEIDPISGDPREPLRHTVGEARIGGTNGAHDQRSHRAHRLGDERQEVESTEIGCVEVFEDPDARCGFRKVSKRRNDVFPEIEGVALVVALALALDPE